MPEWMNIAELPIEHPEKRIHMERYEYAARHLVGKRILDCACGMGYGTDILAARCNATGVDIDENAIALARARYPERKFEVGDIHQMSFCGYDSLASFETLEHLDNPESVIERLPASITEIVASVPIRPTVGWNAWHRSDFTKTSFREMIARYFAIAHEFGQMWVDGEDLYMVIHGRR
jgi:2-polyprenyl-3-methyl-5-hydroxy-6-metoxy-1,4-benzoquinol methylase